MKNKFKTYAIAGLILGLGIFLGATLFSSESNTEKHDHAHEQNDDSVWTCSMHPQIRKDEPGDCPICGMDLIPASKMEDGVDPEAIRMSKTARKLAQVETMTVGEEASKSNMNFSGRLEVNQDNTSSISANFKARIVRLYINEEGEEVQKGQVIAELYAPEIQVLKDELELATQQNNEVLLKSITKKIENYELSVSDIQSLENARLKLRSPKNGVISSLNVKQGDNVKSDQNLMRIADLSSLWAIIDVYESDLNRINNGDELKIRIPNEDNVTGKVTFVSPVLNANSRSAKARVVIYNPNRNLKPGVFITAELMNTKSESAENQALMVPKSAVLWTGKRSVVYQQLENENGVYFKMKEVETGSSSSDFIEILSGLEAGDEVVTRGAFSIDSEAQLSDKPSMMNPDGGSSSSGHNHGDMKMNEDSSDSDKANAEISSEAISDQTDEVKKLINDYSELKNALVSDDFETSKAIYKKVNFGLSKLDRQTFKEVDQLNGIDDLRDTFIQLSEDIIAMAKASNPNGDAIYIQQCPMADRGEGARWLSFSKEVKNPYYGASMLKCGSVIDSIN
ncbi:efflux RND transporter periplasmic adaptor subunit [Psychroflexus montanilacus]|uniref:efflux RND transporter periplasmic adaptor subunit n=1 Tax=Psychroflexus montanilacus TaxID=2873598 RepID=UPI001CCD1B32|nr:efflux RND transporter periplasmic adaptor subunit [Psychroflexus montanilacus]MBZ9652185.1 efflux RND transporter periplasmic adaptor subunit [Psychroflexus montanilacus]